MQDKTVQELRTLARDQGIKGYSRMRKDELLAALAADAPPASIQSRRSPQQAPSAQDQEQRVEDSKYATTPPGTVIPEHFVSDLSEDIDYLPSIHTPSLSLLPQKPGILHGHWSLEPGRLAREPGLRLRLSHVNEHQAMVLEEVPLPADQGRWYFHVDPGLQSGHIYLQLGYYRDDGDFITAIEHGIVSLPRLYPSARVDRAWWISEEEFRRLYLSAGGLLRGGRLAWGAAVASSWPTSWSGLGSGGMRGIRL